MVKNFSFLIISFSFILTAGCTPSEPDSTTEPDAARTVGTANDGTGAATPTRAIP